MDSQSYYGHCKDLYDKKLYQSCMSVLSLTLACINGNKDDPVLHLCLSLKAECCYQLGYLDRAIENYDLAISYLTSKSIYELPTIGLTSSNFGENPNRIKRKSILQEKIGTCWFELGIFEKSVIELEKIPEGYKSFPARVTLFKACINISSSKAYNYGLQILRESPTALEVIDMLIDLDEANISDILDFQLEPWIKSYIEFKFYSSRLKFLDSKISLEIIQKTLPSSIKVYVEESNFYYRQGDFTTAIEVFEKVLKLDPMENEGIGAYFNMLAFMERGEDIKNIVSRHSGNGIPKTSHCLIGLARVWEAKENISGALLLIQKAIDLNDFNIDAIIAKAQLLCKNNQYIESLREFQLAFGVQKNFMIYEGFVFVAIKAKEFRLAKVVAANAIQNMPSNYRALLLMGLVYFFTPCDSLMADKDNISIAQGYFDKAALNSPNAPEPIIWKAAIERKNRNYQVAKTLLYTYLENIRPCELVYTQLGYICCITKDFIGALEHFKKALSLQKNMRVARLGRDLALDNIKEKERLKKESQLKYGSQSNPGEEANSSTLENADPLVDLKLDPNSVMNPLLVPLFLSRLNYF